MDSILPQLSLQKTKGIKYKYLSDCFHRLLTIKPYLSKLSGLHILDLNI